MIEERFNYCGQRELHLVFEMVLKGEDSTDMQVGQFVHLRCQTQVSSLRRPNFPSRSCDYDKKRGNICLSCGRERQPFCLRW